MKKLRNILVLSFLLAASVAGFTLFFEAGHEVEAAESAAQAAPQAMPVDIETVSLQDIQIWKNFSGHVVAVDRAEIRPQVSGRITEISFEDGQHVEVGDVLIVIDPRPYEAALSQAKASLKVAETRVILAEKEYERAKALVKKSAVSQSLLDERTNELYSSQAAVQGAKAELEIAQINLDYAYVKAPISGKISRAEITIGNLVQAGANAPVLTTIVADEKVYVDFEVDEKTYINFIRNQTSEEAVPVRVELGAGNAEYRGVIHSFDNKIDQLTGTIRARAVFENTEKLMLPGMSVTVLMGGNNADKKILISERAIGTDQDRKFVYTVNGDSVVEYREVKIGDSTEGRRVILAGLDSGEKVITEGLVRIRPGMPVIQKPKAE